MTRKAMHPANTLSYLKRFLSEQMKEETQGRNCQPRWVGLESVVEIVLVVIVQHAYNDRLTAFDPGQPG